MEKSINELAKELFMKNPYESFSTIEVKDERGNLFTFLFKSIGYNEYTQHIFKCHSGLFERPISFYITTIHDSFDFYNVEYDSEASKHEETLRHAIELALPVKPAKWHSPYEKPSWWDE